MKAKGNRLLATCVVLAVLFSLLQPFSAEGSGGSDDNQPIAILVKVIEPVNVRRADKEEPVPAAVDQFLYPGDRLTCGDDGYAAIMFLDDAAELKMLPNTDLTLQGKRGETGIIKRIFLPLGRLLSRVLRGELEVVTPTSVASVKGTQWWTLVDTAGTRVLVMEGEVRVLSRVTGASAAVEAGSSVLNTASGEMTIKPFDPSDLPASDPPADTGSLEIEFKDDRGSTKTLRIEFKRE